MLLPADWVALLGCVVVACVVVSGGVMPGRKWRSIKRPRVYESLRKRGVSKARAARIANAQRRKKGK